MQRLARVGNEITGLFDGTVNVPMTKISRDLNAAACSDADAVLITVQHNEKVRDCVAKVISCLCAVFLAASIFADTWIDPNTEIVWDYTISDGKATLRGASPAEGSLNIPTELGGCPVTSIGGRAFFCCSGLTSVTIPGSVTSIGDSAFRGCSRLTSITIPDGVTSIGGSAFFGCSGLTNVVISASVTSIGDYAFSGCSGLTSITIPDSVTSIWDSAFFGCSGLTSIMIPDSVTSIGGYAFYGCSGLTNVVIPASVTSIGYSAFSGCSGLTSITIPDSVTSIWDSAFFGCSGLTSIMIPDSVTSIGGYAFYGCSGLTNVVIPASVTSIGYSAFSGCSGLTSVIMPDDMTGISATVFNGCLKLQGILPGFVVAKFTGSVFNSSSDVYANAIGYTIYPEEMYAESLPEKTTVAWAGYMKMEGGVTYSFKGCYDDFATVKINGTWVLSRGGECKEVTGTFTPTATDWYPIEFRVGNNGGGGGIQNSSTQYGILWKRASDTEWHKVAEVHNGEVFTTGTIGLKPLYQQIPFVFSSQMRANDPTVMDVTYIGYSPQETVNVRTLAFEDGERSFAKVVRPETFVKDPDGNETAQNVGDGVPANVEHKLAWKVSSDWATRLSKVKFEVLASDELLPLELRTIPASETRGKIKISRNEISEKQVFDALLWLYASKDAGLTLTNGALKNGSTVLANGSRLGDKAAAARYVYSKMGFDGILSGTLLNYVNSETRLGLSPSGVRQYAYKIIPE